MVPCYADDRSQEEGIRGVIAKSQFCHTVVVYMIEKQRNNSKPNVGGGMIVSLKFSHFYSTPFNVIKLPPSSRGEREQKVPLHIYEGFPS